MSDARAYYNEHDPKTAAWLRELIAEGHIAPGDVDERSITDVRPHELTGYCQQHFFAGIGGWSLALRLAGWPDNRSVRTGSCPCQPFSQAGKGLCEKDERHLWPNFRDLITFGEPTITFGEQVASKDGRVWLAGIRADLEALGYEVGGADLCAAGVGAPHPRQRLYWMAYPNGSRRGQAGRNAAGHRKTDSGRAGDRHGNAGSTCGLVHANSTGRNEGRQGTAATGYGNSTKPTGSDGSSGLEQSPGIGRGGPWIQDGRESEVAGAGEANWMAVPAGDRWERPADSAEQDGRAFAGECGTTGRLEHAESDGREQWRPESVGGSIAGRCGWSDYDMLPFRDGKFRRVETGTFPLANGVSGRVGLLRGYGNAIVPALAAEFIQASIEAINLTRNL